MAYEKLTVKKMIDCLEDFTERDWYYYKSEFLHGFNSKLTTDEERFELLREKPVNYPKIPKYVYAIMAGYCQGYLYNKGYDFKDMPHWTVSSEYDLDEPYFAGGVKGAMKVYLLLMTPVEYKCRNVFIEAEDMTVI